MSLNVCPKLLKLWLIALLDLAWTLVLLWTSIHRKAPTQDTCAHCQRTFAAAGVSSSRSDLSSSPSRTSYNHFPDRQHPSAASSLATNTHQPPPPNHLAVRGRASYPQSLPSDRGCGTFFRSATGSSDDTFRIECGRVRDQAWTNPTQRIRHRSRRALPQGSRRVRGVRARRKGRIDMGPETTWTPPTIDPRLE